MISADTVLIPAPLSERAFGIVAAVRTVDLDLRGYAELEQLERATGRIDDAIARLRALKADTAALIKETRQARRQTKGRAPKPSKGKDHD